MLALFAVMATVVMGAAVRPRRGSVMQQLASRSTPMGFVRPAAMPINRVMRPASVMPFGSRTVTVFAGADDKPKRTRENEPSEYFRTNLDTKSGGERFADPQVLIALVGILLPFVAVGILFSSGYLTR